MMFIKKRLRQVKLYLGLIVGIAIIISHTIFELLPHYFEIEGNTHWFLTANSWIGFSSGSFCYAYYLLLPLLTCLSFNQVLYQDFKSGFYSKVVSTYGEKKYFVANLLISFIGGILTTVIPLTLDLLLTWCLTPNLAPDTLLNYGGNVLHGLTYLPELFYSHPIRLICFYILLAGITGGVYSIASLVIIAVTKKYFTGIAGVFAISVVWDAFTAISSKATAPTLITMPFSPAYLPKLTTYLLLLLAATILICISFFWRGEKRVFS